MLSSISKTQVEQILQVLEHHFHIEMEQLGDVEPEDIIPGSLELSLNILIIGSRLVILEQCLNMSLDKGLFIWKSMVFISTILQLVLAGIFPIELVVDVGSANFDTDVSRVFGGFLDDLPDYK